MVLSLDRRPCICKVVGIWYKPKRGQATHQQMLLLPISFNNYIHVCLVGILYGTVDLFRDFEVDPILKVKVGLIVKVDVGPL